MLKQFPSIDDDRKPLPEKDAGDVGVRDDSLAVFDVAICGQKDNLLLQLNGPIHGSNITVFEAELTTLKLGLTEAASLGITRISIYCDYYPIYHFVSLKKALDFIAYVNTH
ncbi:unnamed protein product [Arabidopsis halleri]